MGTPLGPKYIPYTYMDPLGLRLSIGGGREVQVPKASAGGSQPTVFLEAHHPGNYTWRFMGLSNYF